MASDGSIIIDTRVNTDGFKAVGNMSSGFSKSMKKMGAVIAAAFAVKKVVEFSAACLELGSDLQEVQNVVDSTFTTMSEKVNEFAKNATATAGLSETMAKQYAGMFGAMAKSFGFAEAEAYSMATSLTQLAGDVASFYNLDQDVAYTKLKSVFSGETETLKDLGVVMTQSALDAYALEKGLGKTTKQMSEQEKVALRYRFVVEQLNGASGDFVRTQDGWANQTRVLTLQWNQLKATLGQGLINVLTPLIQVVNKIISKLQTAAEAFRDFTAAVFGEAGGSSGSVSEEISDAVDGAYDLEDGLTSAGKAAKSLAGFDELNILGAPATSSGGDGGGAGSLYTGGAIPDVEPPETSETEKRFEKLFKSITNGFEELKESVKSYAGLFTPTFEAWKNAFSGLVAPAKEAFESISGSLMKLWEETLKPFYSYFVSDWIPSLVNSFSTNLAPIFEDLTNWSMKESAIDIQNSCKIITDAMALLRLSFDNAKRVFTDMCDSIGEKWDESGGRILEKMSEFKESVWNIFMKVWGVINDALTKVGETFSRLWINHLKPLWDNIVDFVMDVWEYIMILWNEVLAPIVNFLVEVFKPIVVWVWDAICDAVEVVVGIIADVIGGLLNVLKGILKFLTGIFTLNWERIWEGIKDIFGGIMDAIGGIFKGVVNVIIWIFNRLWTLVYAAIASIANGLGSLVSWIGSLVGQDDWGWEVPNDPPQIPYLAHGAVLPANKPFMAVVGDQKHGTNIEAPLDTIKEAVREELYDMTGGMMAGFEALLEENKRLRAVVEGIEIGDSVIGKAVDRYNRQRAIMAGRT